ncbi:MAG: hypothetical protein MMC23_006761 [Stictis urceolatum]|nr:hypothetical protein [Stictis urceolata]
MRGKRSKQYRKLLERYAIAFGFREPYQIIVDAQILQLSRRLSMDLVSQLARTLHGEIKPMITQCSIRHLYALPVSTSATTSATSPDTTISPVTKTALLDLSRSLTLRRCGHHTLPQPLSPLDCISSVVDPKSSGQNKHRLVLACQDETVRSWARSVKGVPSLFVNKMSVLVMERMAESSMEAMENAERWKLRSGARRGLERSSKRKREEDPGEEGRESRGLIQQIVEGHYAKGNEYQSSDRKGKRKARGPKGPNPLSIKKKKRSTSDERSGAILGRPLRPIREGEEPAADGRRRKRTRTTSATHAAVAK